MESNINNNNELLCEMDVKLKEGNVVVVKVYKNSDPEEMAFKICKEYDCGFEVLKNIKARIKNVIEDHKEHNENKKKRNKLKESKNELKNHFVYDNSCINDNGLVNRTILFKPEKSPLLSRIKHPLKNNFLFLKPEYTYNSNDVKDFNDKYNQSHISLMKLAQNHKVNVISHNTKKRNQYKSKSISIKEKQLSNMNIPKDIQTPKHKTNVTHHQSTSSLSALSDYTNQILFGKTKNKPKITNNTFDLAFRPCLYMKTCYTKNNNVFYNKPKSQRSNRLNTSKQFESDSYLKHYLSKSLLNTKDHCTTSKKSLTNQKMQLQRFQAVEVRKEKMFRYLINNFVSKEKNGNEQGKMPKDIEQFVKCLFPKNFKDCTKEKLLSYMKEQFEKISFLDKKCLFEFYHNININ